MKEWGEVKHIPVDTQSCMRSRSALLRRSEETHVNTDRISSKYSTGFRVVFRSMRTRRPISSQSRSRGKPGTTSHQTLRTKKRAGSPPASRGVVHHDLLTPKQC